VPLAGEKAPALALTDVTYSYSECPALQEVGLRVESGECVALMGPSGCGKSTLLMVASGILAPDRGSVTVRGKSLSQLSRDGRATVRRLAIGLVFQFGELVSELSLRDNVALAAELAGSRRGVAVDQAQEVLASVGLGELGARFPGEVSGGQAQRVAVARALVHRPGLVLADEPTGALDSANASAVLDLLVALAGDIGAGVLIATHDPAVAARCSRVAQMSDGRIVVADATVAR
jgi:putative ABC transport system ATP-binding protein